MRKAFFTLMMALCVAAAASVASSVAKNSKPPADSIKGVISDSHCGAKHASASDEDKQCVAHCLKGGQEAVLLSDGKVYKLDQTGQDKAKEFAGEKVTVTGSVSGENISVTSIERN